MDDTDDPAVAVVKRWPRLRGEPKDAWQYLWKRCRRRPDSLWVYFAELAAEQGKSDRSARRWIDTLASCGLIEVMEQAPNRVRLYVKEPREVCGAPERPGPDHAQPLFEQTGRDETAALPPAATQADRDETAALPPSRDGPSADFPRTSTDDSTFFAAQGPADSLTQPPRNRRTSAASRAFSFGEGLVKTKLSVSGNIGALKNTRVITGSAGDETAALPPSLTAANDAAPQPADPQLAALQLLEREARAHNERAMAAEVRERPIAQVAQGRSNAIANLLPGNAELRHAVESLADHIRRRVNDPKLHKMPCIRAARAVVIGDESGGRLPMAELDGILAWVGRKNQEDPRTPRWVLFTGAIAKACRRHGIEWPRPSQASQESLE